MRIRFVKQKSVNLKLKVCIKHIRLETTMNNLKFSVHVEQ